MKKCIDISEGHEYERFVGHLCEIDYYFAGVKSQRTIGPFKVLKIGHMILEYVQAGEHVHVEYDALIFPSSTKLIEYRTLPLEHIISINFIKPKIDTKGSQLFNVPNTEEGREKLVEDDQLSPTEAGFMEGAEATGKADSFSSKSQDLCL